METLSISLCETLGIFEHLPANPIIASPKAPRDNVMKGQDRHRVMSARIMSETCRSIERPAILRNIVTLLCPLSRRFECFSFYSARLRTYRLHIVNRRNPPSFEVISYAWGD